MKFNSHFDLEGKHAELGASKYSWLGYSDEKMRATYVNEKRREEGTELHAMASSLIKKRMKMPKLQKAFNKFVNDAIGFNMHSEVVLFYSYKIFGTADAISFRNGELRIHDLKTGVTHPSFKQLSIYAALFCLEYDIDPFKIVIVERLYQNSDFTEFLPTPEEIAEIMDKIEHMDNIVKELDSEYYDSDF